MKNVLKYIGFSLLGIIILAYFAFLIVPQFIKLDNYKQDIQKIVKENSKLNFDYSSIKLYTTPLLSIGVDIKDINVFYDDGTSFLKTTRLKGGLALPSLFTLTAKTSRIYIDNPSINLEIVNSAQYKIVKLIEGILNEQNKKAALEINNETVENETLNNILKKVRIKVPFIKITDYHVEIVDNKSVHNLKLNGEELILKYSGARNKAKIKTVAKLYFDKQENINLDLDLTLPTPKISLVNDKPKELPDPDEEIQIPFVNIIDIYQTYDFKTNVKSKLKIVESKKMQYLAYGFLNIDDLTLRLSHTQLPESYFHAKFNSNKIDYDTNIYVAKDEKISLIGRLIHGKKCGLKADIKSDEIKFANMLNLLKGLLDSLNIKNDIASIKTTGHLIADAQINTDFKKLKSNGFIKVQDGSFLHSKINLGIKDLKADLNFSDNALNIQNTQAVVNNSFLKITGLIDSNSNVDLNLNVQNLFLPDLYNTFAPQDVKKAYNLTGANLSLSALINGKLNNLNAKISAKLNNLALSDSKKTMFLTNSAALFNLEANKELINAKFEDSNFIFNIPSANIKTNIAKIAVNIDNNSIVINPFDIIYNTSSKITAKGKIDNYSTKPDINLFFDGFISTLNINQTLGKEASFYVPSKGNIPIKASLKGNGKEQNILAQIYCDANNFVSPINISILNGAPSIIQASIKMKGNKIKLNNSGLYKKANSIFDDNLEANIDGAKQIVEVTAITEGNHLNLFRLNIPHELSASIAIFKKSSFKTIGKILINGPFDDLSYKGNLKIYDINIPELLTSVKNLDLNLSSKTLKLGAGEVNLNGSKINSRLSADLKPAKIFKISNLEVFSSLFDVDKTMLILNELNKYMPPAPKKSAKKQTASTAQNIPLSVEGKFDIKKIKTGQMEIFNSKGNLFVKNNVLLIDKLTCNGFQGAINGNISVNLISQLINIKLNGTKLNADELFYKAANMKDTISGTMAFKTDISLKGQTYQEQMKSLLGDVDFEIVDGQYGPFAKLENFFLAENIRENAFFKNSIGVILTPLTTIDSSHFEKLKGRLTFKNGYVKLNPITSQGDILAVLISGNMNLLSNNLDSYVRVRLASAVSDMLGPLAMANPVNLVKNTPGMNIATAKLFTFFTQVVCESDYNLIPDFSSKHSDDNATKFQIVLKGDAAKPLKLVKSFKWLALEKDMLLAQEISDKYIKEQQDLARQALVKKLQEEYEVDNRVKVGVEKVLKMDTTAPAIKEMILKDVLSAIQNRAGIVPVSQTQEDSSLQNENE